jgi:molybdate transport system substrate-binding protein
MRRHRTARPAFASLALAALALVLPAAGCGSDDDGGGGAGKPRLVVFAAASMTEALTDCTRDHPDATVRLSFAGSDELAAQIRAGVEPDVYAAANTKLPDALHEEGLLGEPLEFATNELVLAVPKGSDIDSVSDVAQPGVKVAIGSETVPIGSYTRETLARLPPRQARTILANVRSSEPDVKGIVGKLTQGAVDAGFVYVTDVQAAGGELEAIDLPAEAEPEVTYAAGVVEGAEQPEQARAFVNGLSDGRCADALRAAGFGPAP